MGGWDDEWDTYDYGSKDRSHESPYSSRRDYSTTRRSYRQETRDLIESKKRDNTYYELPLWYREKLEYEAR